MNDLAECNDDNEDVLLATLDSELHLVFANRAL